MNVITLSSLFPGSEATRHGVFVKERMKGYRQRTGHKVRVVAPVPFFPRLIPSRKYGHYSRMPRSEQWEGFEIHHPRYLMIPGVGVPVQGALYYAGARKTVQRLHQQGRLDVLDVHYAYPDGYAGALMKRRLKVPMVLTLQGTDVNLLPKLKSTRSQIRFALQSADRVVTVSQALVELAVDAGAAPEKVSVIPSGVDVERFTALDREVCRQALGIDSGQTLLVSIGFLVRRKGLHHVVRALSLFSPEDRPYLVIVGDGPEEGRLRSLALELGLSEHVRLVGPREHDSLSEYYSAADFFVLASSREGMPNVVLESLACGTPVIASDVHGTPEVINDPSVGTLIRERTPDSIAAAIRKSRGREYDRGHIRAYARTMSWDRTADALRDVYRKAGAGSVGYNTKATAKLSSGA